MRSRLLILGAALPLLLAVSCAKGGFTEVCDLPGSQWPAEWAINFEFTPSDTVSRNNIDLIVRHGRNEVPASLTLEVKTVAPSLLFWCDTISAPLRDADGKWIGKEFSAGIDLSVNYRRNAVFGESGKYGIAIRQLQSPDTLRCVMAVGASVYPAQNR